MIKKRLLALTIATVLLVTLVGGVLPTSALWIKTELAIGDVDGEGGITTTDARMVLQYAAEKIELTSAQQELALVSTGAAVSTTDARLILQYAAEKIKEFPRGKVYASTYSAAETTPNANPEGFATYTAGNPIVTSMFTADPSAHVWNDGRLYVYPSHDIFPAQGCDLMDKYHVFSTDNMVDWRDEGQILQSGDVQWSNCNGFMWAPDCAYIEATDTYYYYFPHPLTDDQLTVGENQTDRGWNWTWVMGVAKSVGSPTGPFEQVGYVKLDASLTNAQMIADANPYLMEGDRKKSQNTGFFDSSVFASLKGRNGKTLGENGVSGVALGGYSLIDPCLFVDDDGRCYLSYGGGGNCFIVELDSDMVTAKTLPKKIAGLQDFHEGSWFFKNPNNGFYYMMYADNNSGRNRQRYAISKSITGPYSYAGVILDENDCDTSHGSICQYKGNWYIFYHNCSISGQGNLRSICVDQLKFDEDGRIQKIAQTKTGVAAVGPAAPSAGGSTNIPAASFTVKTDYDLTSCTVGGGAQISNGGTTLNNMHIAGSWAEFSGIDGGKGGKALVTVNYSAQNNATAKVLTKGDKTGDGYFLRMNATGSWTTYKTTATCIVDLVPGAENTIRFVGGSGFNMKGISVSLLPENANT